LKAGLCPAPASSGPVCRGIALLLAHRLAAWPLPPSHALGDGAKPPEHRQTLPIDALRQVWQDGATMKESEKQFSFTRAGPSTSGRAKSKFLSVLAAVISGCIALLISASSAFAQAPSSLVGDGFLAGISSGAYPLATYGYYLFIPANSGNAYQVIGIYNVINSSGTYTYTPTSASTATLNVNDSVGGAGVLSASFTSASSGSFYETANSYPGAYQSGSFGFSSVNAPSSLAGRTFNCSVVNGASPLLTSGSYTITIANSGNTYTVSTGQSGTYSYSTLNRSTGIVQLNDSVTGVTTAYFGFSSATGGGFAIKASSGTGYQVGNFVLLDTNPPTVAITAPTTGQDWNNSVFTITGTASDNVQVAAVYYQINSQGWNLASTANNWANNWANWSANIALLPGTNIIQAYSVDTSGNSSPINTQNMFYVLPAPISVQINGSGTISPNYNGQMLDIGNSYSMTATPSAGVVFTGWTGSLTTNSSTIQFIMASNLLLQANFVDGQKPTNSITSPTSGQLWSNATFTVTGKASDNVAVSNVFYSLNNAAWTSATTANNWSNWTAAVNLIAGTNTIQAYAVDTSSNISTTNSVSFNAVLSTVLTVSTNGLGSLNPNYNNALLQVGKGYSITATAGTGFAFTNWTGGVSLPLAVLTNKATLQFVMQSNLVLQANFADTNRPVLSITNLTAGQRWSNLVFTAEGKATDNWQVASVQCQLNGGIWTSATGTTNWSAPLTLTPGTNTFAAYAIDNTGNNSTTNNVSFQFVVTNLLAVQATGLGTISPNYSNAWLEIGHNYSMTATPATGFVVTNWTISTNWLGGRITNNATVQFVMASNLTLQANFAEVTKPTLTVSSPTSGQKMTNALATVIGTASDNWKVDGVWYQLNGGAWSLAATTNSFTNWTTTLNLISGTNTVKSYALDWGGNFSTTNNLSVVSSNTFMLQLVFTNALPLNTNGLVFSLQLSKGLNGHIQVSSNLTSWVALTNFVGTNTTLNFLDSAATNSSHRFYRAVIP
jgi:hypothetical protein